MRMLVVSGHVTEELSKLRGCMSQTMPRALDGLGGRYGLAQEVEREECHQQPADHLFYHDLAPFARPPNLSVPISVWS